mmetsp:Transcript_92256/g.192932  ORF Transcript_92256/g.192932 Transcript_92256/m.192932 type:complete len:588 (+) Transcript_92256:112-1875(+)
MSTRSAKALALALSWASLASASESAPIPEAQKTARRYHAAPVGSKSCGSKTSTASQETCLAAVNELLPDLDEELKLELGSFKSAPPGCSMRLDDKLAAVYNMIDGVNDGSYSPVCVGAGRRAAQCSLPRVSELSDEQFEDNYRKTYKPFIFNGAVSGWQEEGYEPWDVDGFSAAFGTMAVPLRDPELLIEMGSNAPLLEGSQTVAEYLVSMQANDEPIPVVESSWQQPLVRKVRSLLKPQEVPALKTIRGETTVAFGGQSTGVSWRMTTEQWVGQVLGVTRWFLYESTADGVTPQFRFDACSLLDFPPADLEVTSCETQPGDAIYIPAGYWYASCNTQSWNLAVGAQGSVAGLSKAHLAVLDNDVDALGTAGKDELNSIDENTLQTPTHLAVTTSNLEMLKTLQTLGANLTIDGGNSSTPLLTAARLGETEILKWFKSEGHSMASSDNRNSSPLHKAARFGREETVNWLLTQPEVQPWSIDKRKQTALHGACQGDHMAVVKKLAEVEGYEEAKEMRDRRGQSALDLAVQVGANDVARFLGAEVIPGEGMEIPHQRPDLDEDEPDEEFESDTPEYVEEPPQQFENTEL